MSAGPAPLPTGAEKRVVVRAMFDRIAPRYDALNRLFTAGFDRRWRALALDAAGVGPADRVLDLACGTGDLAEAAAARGARVLGVDFAREMLRGARRRRVRATLIQGDAAAMPVRDGAVDALVCGFALRNFSELECVLRESARVLAPGGRIALLDVDRPTSRLLRAGHSLYFDHVVPTLGGWLSDRAAYAYLPRSTHYLPPARELLAAIADAGFEAVEKRRLAFGAVQLIRARRTVGTA